MEQALTTKEAAHQLGVSTRTVYRMIEENQLYASKVRGVYRITPETIRRTLAPKSNNHQDSNSVGLDVQGVEACQHAVSIVGRTRPIGGRATSTAAGKELAALLKLPTAKKQRQS